jgi:glucan endo-1,3-beta-D-glucosidase
MRTSTFLSIAAALASSVSATVYQGFNYGSTFTDGSAKTQSDFEAEFKSAKNLVGTSGAFTSARLYTMIVCAPSEARRRLVGKF